jgi:hypothetical protein
MVTLAWRDGSGWPLPKQTILECSKNRPTMDFTRMLSDNPGMPGLRQQIPLMMRSTVTPACDARYRRSMTVGSTSEFIFAQMVAGRPASAFSISLSMSSNMPSLSALGAIQSFFRCTGRA